MNLRNGYAQYREQSILTASPGDLVLLLYDGCLRQLRLAQFALQPEDSGRPDIQRAGQALVKAQEIIDELIQGLDFNFELSQNLFSLYEYANERLQQANMHKDCALIAIVEADIAELRATWEQALRTSRAAGLAAGE